MRIYLIGYSYGGKTTMGRQLARLLNYEHFDTDKAIETKFHTSISMLINHYSEQAFRIIERQMLFSTASLDNVVVSTGGGAACCDDNIKFILEHGIAIHMQMTVDDVMERLKKARRSRPLLTSVDDGERRSFITEQLTRRMPFYSQAPLSVSAMTATPEELKTLIENYKS